MQQGRDNVRHIYRSLHSKVSEAPYSEVGNTEVLNLPFGKGQCVADATNLL